MGASHSIKPKKTQNNIYRDKLLARPYRNIPKWNNYFENFECYTNEPINEQFLRSDELSVDNNQLNQLNQIQSDSSMLLLNALLLGMQIQNENDDNNDNEDQT